MMPKSTNQKLKILYLMRMLEERTDDAHVLTLAEIQESLASLGISAERKSLYDDMEALRTFGIPVERRGGKDGGYYIAERTFQLPELKLLVDAVQSSKFITKKKSTELIAKIASFTSTYEARQLDRQVFVTGRVKTDNEQVYYNVDNLHRAISSNRAVTFQYFEWNTDKEKILRHGGALYTVSPFALTWDNENYYLVAYDHMKKMIHHYRVDKMLRITVTDTPREGKELFDDFDMALYSREVFGMFGGRQEIVTLDCDNSLIGVVIDRFGEDLTIIKKQNSFEIHQRVMVSSQFYSWVFGFGGKMRILSPAPWSRGSASTLRTSGGHRGDSPAKRPGALPVSPRNRVPKQRQKPAQNVGSLVGSIGNKIRHKNLKAFFFE